MNSNELPKILFISPTIPGGYKNGLSMRARMWLSVLQQKYQVYLLVIPVADGKIVSFEDKLLKQCKQIHIAKPSLLRRLAWKIERRFSGASYTDQILSNKFLHKAGKEFWGINFDAIHVLRIYLTPTIKPFVEASSPLTLTLDLDDLESLTHQRLAELYQKLELQKAAEKHLKLSQQFQKIEAEVIQQFNQIFVCSNLDSSRLEAKGFSNISVVPNSMPIQNEISNKLEASIFSILFVGNFQYFPNQDAINWLLSDIIPVIRSLTTKEYKITLLGSGKLPNIAKLQKIPELAIIQDVPDLQPFYQSANAVIAPIRAGGGTRIKIIEAFSYHVPVVSTSLGIEGIDAIHNKHALVADDPVEFARCCVELMNNTTLRNNIRLQAAQLFKEHYSTDIVEAKALSMLKIS